MKTRSLKATMIASTALTAVALSGAAFAADSPFHSQQGASLVQVADGSCGANMKKSDGSCGANMKKDKEHSCGGNMKSGS